MQTMSAADLSVLDASAHTRDSNMTTAPGSPNELLWTRMLELGWTSKRQEALDLPGRAPLVMNIYAIRPEGVEPILSLLAALGKG
jgi:hypothetical protein